MNNKVFAIPILLILTACGGSGGGSGGETTTPGPSNASFLTTSPDTDEVGESQRFDLSGTASGNGETLAISGSYSTTRKPNEDWSSGEVVVYDVVLVLSFPSQGTSVSSGVTSYANVDGTFLMQRLDTGVECFPNDNYAELPTSVKIGENGVLGSVNCSDGTTISGSYLVEESGRNSAWAAIRVYATTTTPGNPDIYEDVIWHLSEDGRIHALELSASDNVISFELTS